MQIIAYFPDKRKEELIMNNQTTKQKLIDLVSALETENSIEYFYRFIAMKLYGKADCPSSHFREVCEVYEQFEKRWNKENPKKPELTEIEKEHLKYVGDISKELYSIDATENGLWCLDQIYKFVVNIQK